MTAIVFSIEEFSAFDGAGLRTSVFFKGCPLRCEWRRFIAAADAARRKKARNCSAPTAVSAAARA